MNQNTKTTPKDFFLHLGATIILYTSAVSLFNLVFSIINYIFPDALAGYFSTSSIAWPISMLIILIPVLYILEWSIKKDIALVPEKDSLWIRRWRTYLTLFLAGATIIGDLIALINTYINGEITERFVYKFLVILIIFGIIFTYYILERTTKTSRAILIQKILAWLGILVVVASIVGGFLIVGSPYKQRALRFDAQRISDLSTIQYQIINFWQRKARLPASIDELKDPLSGSVVPVDPENKNSYEYIMKTDKSFEICANFREKSEDGSGKGGSYSSGIYPTNLSYPYTTVNDNWKHDAGRACFDRTIDPQLYPTDKATNPQPYRAI